RRSISPTISPHIVMRGPPSQLLDAPGSAKRFCRSAAALLSRRLQRRLGGRFVYVEHRTPHREPPGTMFREYPQITTRCVELLRRALVEILHRRLHALDRRRHTDHVNVGRQTRSYDQRDWSRHSIHNLATSSPALGRSRTSPTPSPAYSVMSVI